MRKVMLVSVLSSVFASTALFSTTASAYYQDKYNPNSPTYDQSTSGYYQGKQVSTKRTYRPAYYNSMQNRTFDFPADRDPTGKPVFIYDPKQLSWAVYNGDGQLVRTGPGSSGRDYCADIGRGCRTPSGTYSVYSKQGPYYRSKIFPVPNGGAPMPYAMFFRGGYAIHGSYDLPPFNASHGCVRVKPEDAAWLSQNILTTGSTVIVRSYN